MSGLLSRLAFGWACLVLPVAVVVGCGGEPDSPADPAAGPAPALSVVATVGMVGDVVGAVAGNAAEVAVLIGPGLDPHLYEPTRIDMQRLVEADLVAANGLMLEGQLIDALSRVADSGTLVVPVAERAGEARLLQSPAPGSNSTGSGHADPHLWMDPSLWAETVPAVLDALIKLDPASAETFRLNAAEYASRLAELDAYAESVLATVPEDRRVLVTAHDAFGYFGSRYGFEVVGIQGISTESEAGVLDIERIVDVLVGRGITAVFVESSVSDRNVKALIAGAAAQGHAVAIGGQLYSDAMGEAGTYEGTYIGMIDHNVTTIARALGGTAPARGMQGKLGLGSGGA